MHEVDKRPKSQNNVRRKSGIPSVGVLTTQGPSNTRVLAFCQALYTLALSIDLTLTGVAGYSLAEDKSFATLPFSLITIAAAATTLYASLLMGRIGRRRGFMLGASAASLGGAISVWALFHSNFVAFCLGTALVGVFQAFAQYYRLAAADAVEPRAKERAIATVLTGGIVAAIIGPAIARWSMDILPIKFAGAYSVVMMFGLCSIALLSFAYADTQAPRKVDNKFVGETARTLGEILRQPIYVAAVVNNAVGYAVMMCIMTATPIAVIGCGHSMDDSAHIIQWHMVGMFAPSLITASLIKRYGIVTVIFTGIGLSALSAGLSLYSNDLLYFYLALAFLGVGWNFMFVGGTTLLALSYRPEERAKAQALSEFVTFGFSALGSVGAGQMLSHFGWQTLNWSMFFLLTVAVIATLWFAISRSTTKD